MNNFNVFHLIMIVLEGGLLFITSNFGIGSVEDKQKIINEEFVEYLFARVIFNIIIFLVPLILIYFINKRFLKNGIEKKLINKSYVLHLMMFCVFTSLFVWMSVMKYL